MSRALQTQAEKKVPANPIALLQDPSFKAQIAAALPRHMTPDRMARIVLTEVRKNPELMHCDPMSFAGAVVQCSQLGLEPGSGLGQAYLIPFNNRRKGIKEVNFLTGYRGLIDLARRSREVDSVVARAVYEADRFDFEYGDDERIVHKPFAGPRKDAGEIVWFYSIARFKGGGVPQREVMSRSEVDWIRDNYSHGNPVWKDHYEAMGRKTLIRRIAKFLPLSPELADALRAEDLHESGAGQENWRVINAEYEPQTVLSEDATTVAEINAAEEQQGQARDAKALLESLAKAVGAITKQGIPTAEVYTFLGFDRAPDWSKLDAPRLVAMLEKLKGHPKAGGG
jgi:recombination protein RecT